MNKRDTYLKKKYDIDEKTYKKMLKKGKGACWICKRLPKPGKNLNVDHEHLTKAQRKAGHVFGPVRGLLCFFCNKYLVGRRKKKDAFLFHNAWRYLENEKDWRTTST